MFIDALLLVFLVATLVLGIKLQIDLNKLPLHKQEFEGLLNKAKQQLENIEKLTERLKYINQSDKESLQRLNVKAKANKEEIHFMLQKSEDILQKLKDVNSINVDNFLENNVMKPNQKEKTANEEIKVNIKKNKLLKQVKDLR